MFYEGFLSSLKIYVFDVLDVIPEPGKPLTKNKLKVRIIIPHSCGFAYFSYSLGIQDCSLACPSYLLSESTKV